MKDENGGRVRRRPRFGWMDSVNKLPVFPESWRCVRQFATDWKEWRALAGGAE